MSKGLGNSLKKSCQRKTFKEIGKSVKELGLIYIALQK